MIGSVNTGGLSVPMAKQLLATQKTAIEMAMEAQSERIDDIFRYVMSGQCELTLPLASTDGLNILTDDGQEIIAVFVR